MSCRHGWRAWEFRMTACAAAIAAAPAFAQQQPPLVPTHVPLQPSARTAITAEWLTDEERKDLRVFHGVWDDRDVDSPLRRAQVALNAWDLDNPVLEDPSVSLELRAEARLNGGDLAGAV